jgi:hypothetical protein
MSVTASSSRSLDIGAVITDTFGVFQRRGAEIGLACLMLAVAPSLVVLGIRLVARLSAQLSLITLVLGIVAFVLGLVLQGGLFYATARDLEGKRASLEDMVRVGFKTCLPLFGLTILVFLAVELGLLLLLVPGVYLFLRWCAAGPALVVEDTGVFGAMKRSAQLTKGRRWATLLAVLIVVLVYAVVYAAFIGMAGGFAGVVALTSVPTVTPFSLAMLGIVSPILSIILSVGTGVFFGALFHQLRGPAGATAAAVAEVFA